MTERRSGFCLTLKTLDIVFISGQMLGQKFDGHPPFQIEVFGQVDLTHSTLTKFINNLIV
jgi:hypothetical protein